MMIICNIIYRSSLCTTSWNELVTIGWSPIIYFDWKHRGINLYKNNLAISRSAQHQNKKKGYIKLLGPILSIVNYCPSTCRFTI